MLFASYQILLILLYLKQNSLPNGMDSGPQKKERTSGSFSKSSQKTGELILCFLTRGIPYRGAI
jgi:hypothetical protein